VILILGLVVVGGYSMIYSGLSQLAGLENAPSTLQAFLGPGKVAGSKPAVAPAAKIAPTSRRVGGPAPPRVGGHTSRP
jgi:hypothetical protein